MANKKHFTAALNNIFRHGDTDIFPFPIENRILFDQSKATVTLLIEAMKNFDEWFTQYPPGDIRSLVPVHHTGFRWATQLDPFWNAFFLGIVLSISEKIESVRLPNTDVFSYRFDVENYESGDLFKRDVSWIDFIKKSLEISENYKYVVICDIADCYGRVSHHKLDNLLRLINAPEHVRHAILKYLTYLTETRSSGLPIGGPAARILAELALNNSDQYLKGSGIKFLRFADDYHIFCDNKKTAYDSLVKISDALDNEGLALQKSKTRILSKAEFSRVTETLLADPQKVDSPIQRLMSLSLRYDPYSPDADENYDELKGALGKIDIIGLLNEQLSQTRVHTAAMRKIISALSYLDVDAQYGAVISMLGNMDNLYPISSKVLYTTAGLMDGFSDEQKDSVCDQIKKLYTDGHEVMGIDSHVAFALRVLGKRKTIDNSDFLYRCYDEEQSPLVRRDIILLFSNWENFAWLSVFKANFGSISDWERRALILASYSMYDEGRHWRDHVKSRFAPFEKIVRDWRADRVQGNPQLPL